MNNKLKQALSLLEYKIFEELLRYAMRVELRIREVQSAVLVIQGNEMNTQGNEKNEERKTFCKNCNKMGHKTRKC